MIKKSKEKTVLTLSVTLSLTLIGLGIIVFSYFDIGNRWEDMYQNGLLTKAWVTQVKREVGNKSLKSACCFYTYQVASKEYSFKICQCDFKIGDSLLIKYNPRQIAEHEVLNYEK